MGIQALPADAVRTIGASQVLHDATAVVKELLDNALDAHATSVAIEISSNTLDSIQVRDNGHGIPPVDRNLVARPHCTSKISTENDLRSIGGSSLGFRGEALASIAEMSGSLTISTRVEGEQVSTALKINQRGEVEGHDRGSLPTGTTVKTTDFMKSNPVRKQVALKSAEKTLAKIKHLLQSYAFARPSIRISLRVLKAKNESANWLYAPKSNANAEDVVLKIAGTRCTTQCAWSIIEDQGFTLQAFLPKADADAGKVTGLGYFTSIDSRPVSSTQGIAKQIAKIYRDMLKKANKAFENAKDPFIYLQLSCPTSSYDANVEPAKDDVLFEDPDIVLQLARRLFDAVYQLRETADVGAVLHSGSPVPNQASHPRLHEPLSPGSQAALNELSSDVDFEAIDIDHPRLPTASGTLQTRHEERLQQNQFAGVTEAFRSNMYGCDEEDLDLIAARPPTGRTEADFEELRQVRKDATLSNPWIIAKMNAPTRRAVEAEDGCQSDAMNAVTPETTRRMSEEMSRSAIGLEAPGLPTPRPSSPSPPRSSFHPSDYVPANSFARDGRLIGSQTLPSPYNSLEPLSLQRSLYDDESQQPQFGQTPMYDYTLSSQTPRPEAGTSLHDIPNACQRRRGAKNCQQFGSNSNPPYKPPMGFQSYGEGRTPGRAVHKAPRPPRDTAGLGELGDLVDSPRPLTPPRHNRDMRDFVTTLDLTADESASSMIERRNYAAKTRAMSFDSVIGQNNAQPDEHRPPPGGILSGRGFIPASELTALEARTGLLSNENSKVAKRRRTATGHALTEIDANESTAFPRDVSQDQLRRANRSISRRRSTAGGDKSRRTKSSQLPLERTPNGRAVQNIVTSVSTSEEAVAKVAAKIDEELSLPAWKQTVASTYAGFTDKPNAEALSTLADSLREILARQASDGEMVMDLGNLVLNAFDTHHRQTGNGIFA